jgi:hypothetical protein
MTGYPEMTSTAFRIQTIPNVLYCPFVRFLKGPHQVCDVGGVGHGGSFLLGATWPFFVNRCHTPDSHTSVPQSVGGGSSNVRKNRFYSALDTKVPTPLPLPAEKTACTGKVSLCPTGSGVCSRTLALQPWLPVLGTIVKLFSSVCVAAELPLLASVTCRRRRPADPASRVTAALSPECSQ